MKKFWKALGLAALAAAVPVRFQKDETGKKKYQSLLISVDVDPNEDGQGAEIGINLGEGLLTNAISSLVGAKKEQHLFADDEPEAAVVEPITIVEPNETADEADEVEAADEAASVEETEADDEAAPVEETEAAEEPSVTEEDFDPEL